MPEEKPLYPLRFVAAEEKERKPWGTETYKLADLGFVNTVAHGGWLGGNTLGELMETYLERIVGETAFEWYGTQFPVQIKFLNVQGRSSLRVNADDETAAQRYDSFGKTALWYVAEAGPGAKLFLGWKHDLTAAECYEKCLDGSIEEVLNAVTPRKGDSYLIRPGTVHAAQGPLQLIEISESSGLCFRLCDWGRENHAETARETQLEEAFDLIDFRAYAPEETGKKTGELTDLLVDCPQLTVTRIRLSDALHIYAEPMDSFFLYACVEGAASVQLQGQGDTVSYELAAGEVLLVPAEVKDFFLVPRDRSTVLLETILGKRDDAEAPAEQP